MQNNLIEQEIDFMKEPEGENVYIGLMPNYSGKRHVAKLTEKDTSSFEISCGSRISRLRVIKGKSSLITCKKYLRMYELTPNLYRF